MHYHIILTEKCNSQCKYCYEKSMQEFDNGLDKKWQYEDTPFESEIKISELKKFLKHSDTLIFYGGEPLLQIKKIKEIIDNINCRFCMQTNGKLLHLLPEKYLKKIDKILISIDGNEKRTDYNKGQGTYKKIIENIKIIKNKGFKGELVARMTLSFPDIFSQAQHILKLNEFSSIHWQIDAGFYKNDYNFEEFEKFVKEYKKEISKLLDFWIEKMKQEQVLKIYPFLGIFESLYYKKPTKLRCGSGYANFTITTSGKLSACPIMNSVKDFYCGDIKHGIKKQIHCIEPCTKCKHFKICGGRCLYSNHAKLWPKKGQEQICKTIIHLITEIKKRLPEIKKLIQKNKIKEKDFEYEKYFGPEIIP